MKVVQQHNNTNSRLDKNGNGYTSSPLSFFSSFHICCQQHKTEEEKEKE